MAEGFRWQLRLTRAAEDDYRNILRWTLEQFGEAQARLYAETLTRTIESLAAGPEVAGSRRRNDIAARADDATCGARWAQRQALRVVPGQPREGTARD